MTRTLLAVICSLTLAGCVQNVRPLDAAASAGYRGQPVYFATNRSLTGKDNLNRFFSSKRAPLSYGVSTVAVPNDYPQAHEASFIQWNLVRKRNPEKHLTLLNIEPLSADAFDHQWLGHDGDGPTSPRLFFIHGYNVSFEKATRLTAKLAYDLNLTRPALLFSWPSEESVAQYTIDEVNLQWAQADLNQLMIRLLQQSADDELILMAHSLGNRALISALLSIIEQQPELASAIRGVVFAAPDIDAEIYARDLAPALAELNLPMTLYVSDRDMALAASHRLHGYPRVGDQIIVNPGIDTIDASAAESEWLGHEYFSQGAHTIADIYQWLIERQPPPSRTGLESMTVNNMTYWRIVAD